MSDEQTVDESYVEDIDTDIIEEDIEEETKDFNDVFDDAEDYYDLETDEHIEDDEETDKTDETVETVDETVETEETEPTEEELAAIAEQEAKAAFEPDENGLVKMPEKMKFEMDGKEFSISQQDVETLVRKQNKLNYADQQLYETKQAQQNITNIIEAMKQDTFGTLEHLGFNVRGLAEQYLADVLTREQLPEDQQRLLRERDEYAQKVAQYEYMHNEQQNQQAQAQVAQLEQNIATEIDTAFQARNLPQNVELFKKTVEIMYNGAQNGQEIDAGTAVDAALNSIKSMISNFLPGTAPDALTEMLGVETVDALRKNNIDKIKAKQISNSKPKKTMSKSARKAKSQIIRPSDWDDEMEKYM